MTDEEKRTRRADYNKARENAKKRTLTASLAVKSAANTVKEYATSQRTKMADPEK